MQVKVTCPKCGKQAIQESGGSGDAKWVKTYCSNCGFSAYEWVKPTYAQPNKK